MKQYDWPGNIRELRNVVEVMAVTCSSSRIDHSSIPEDILNNQNKNKYRTENFTLSAQTETSAKSLRDIEYDSIKQTLLDTYGNVTKTAKTLGLAKSTLYLKIKQYKLDSFIDKIRNHNERCLE
ncbi:helix-turn-helix domain-containing protein [Acinetobacter baumannii]